MKGLQQMQLLYKIFGFLLLLLSNIIEIAAVRELLSKTKNSHYQALFLHLIAGLVIVLGLALFRLRLDRNDKKTAPKDDDRNSFYPNPMFLPAFFMAVFMPVFGPLTVSILALLIRPVSRKTTEVYADYIDYIKSVDSDLERFDKIPEERLILKFLKIEPVVDLLGSKSKAMIWGSIDNLSKRADHSAVELIRASIRQNDAEIKFLASIGLEKMEKQLIDHIEKCHEGLIQKDDLQAHRAYVEAVLDFLNSGIAPAELSTTLIEDALKVVKAAETRFAAEELEFFHAQILASADENKKSLRLIEDLITKNKLEPVMMPFAMEAFFKAGKLQQVKKLINEFAACDSAQDILEKQLYEIDLNELEDFWSGANQELQA